MLNFSLDGTNISKLQALNSKMNADFIKNQAILNTDGVVRKKLQTLYPHTVLSLYLSVMDKLQISNNGVDAKTYQKNIITGIDLKDGRFRSLPNTFNLLNKYFSALPITPDNYKASIASVLKDFQPKSKMYAFYLSWIFKNLYYYKNTGLEATYVSTYKDYLLGKDVVFDDKSEYSSIVTKAKISEKLANGSTIPDFFMADTTTIMHKLSEIYPDNSFSFVLFYDPECVHCAAAIERINAWFEIDKSREQKIKRIAIINSNDKSHWKEFIQKKNLNGWLNLNPGLNNDYQSAFEAYYNPSFFLIDSKGKIIDKMAQTDFWEALIKMK